MRCYSDLIQLNTFEQRFEYLKLNGHVGETTFGFERAINQRFYKSKEWDNIRTEIILRDFGCDLGIEDRQILTPIFVHHMNPIVLKDIRDVSEYLLNPEYLICCSYDTHQAIHYVPTKYYGDISLLNSSIPVVRKPNDTCPWK